MYDKHQNQRNTLLPCTAMFGSTIKPQYSLSTCVQSERYTDITWDIKSTKKSNDTNNNVIKKSDPYSGPKKK